MTQFVNNTQLYLANMDMYTYWKLNATEKLYKYALGALLGPNEQKIGNNTY